MPLYRIGPNKTISQIKPTPFPKEKDLQKLFESNLETLLGVRFIASEFTTGDRQRGRIDSLGLDQDGFPTIIEYKKSSKENVINQGLFYLDWLVDHKGDFTLAAQNCLGSNVKIDWSRPHLILVAESFSDYDKYAVNRIGSNIELWTYRLYGDEIIYLESIFVTETKPAKGGGKPLEVQKPETEIQPSAAETSYEVDDPPVYSIEYHLYGKSQEIVELFETVREGIFLLNSDDTIIEKATKVYIGYKHGKNFTEIQVQKGGLRIWLDISPADLDDPYKIGRDVTHVGHHGTGDVEVRLNNMNDLDKVLALIEQSYKQTV